MAAARTFHQGRQVDELSELTYETTLKLHCEHRINIIERRVYTDRELNNVDNVSETYFERLILDNVWITYLG